MGRGNQQAIQAQITESTTAQTAEQKALMAQQQQVLAAQKQEYRDFKFTNPYANMTNPYAQNVYEDLTVNQESAKFQMEQGSQQRANIMSGLRGAAGGSGIAGLAQALAGQGTLQARQVSADISQQETANQRLTAQGAQQRQTGAAQVQQMQMQGAAAVQAAEAGRTSTLLGMEMGEMAGARAGVQSAYANQMAGFGAMTSMQNARTAMWGEIAGAAVGAAATVATGGVGSDRRLKKNIEYKFDSPSGLPVYNFEYKDSKYGSGVHQGVMSDEIPLEAVTTSSDGYDMVNYSMLDVEFKKVN